MIDVSILRRPPEQRIRTISIFGGEETAKVLYCGRDEMKQIRDLATELARQGYTTDDAYNIAYGRIAFLGWDGLLDGASPLEFNPENCEMLMLGSAEIRTAVITAASSLKAGAEKN